MPQTIANCLSPRGTVIVWAGCVKSDFSRNMKKGSAASASPFWVDSVDGAAATGIAAPASCAAAGCVVVVVTVVVAVVVTVVVAAVAVVVFVLAILVVGEDAVLVVLPVCGVLDL